MNLSVNKRVIKNLKKIGYRIPNKDEFVNGFEYEVRGFKTSWKAYTFPDKPKDMKHHPADNIWVITKIK